MMRANLLLFVSLLALITLVCADCHFERFNEDRYDGRTDVVIQGVLPVLRDEILRVRLVCDQNTGHVAVATVDKQWDRTGEIHVWKGLGQFDPSQAQAPTFIIKNPTGEHQLVAMPYKTLFEYGPQYIRPGEDFDNVKYFTGASAIMSKVDGDILTHAAFSTLTIKLDLADERQLNKYEHPNRAGFFSREKIRVDTVYKKKKEQDTFVWQQYEKRDYEREKDLVKQYAAGGRYGIGAQQHPMCQLLKVYTRETSPFFVFKPNYDLEEDTQKWFKTLDDSSMTSNRVLVLKDGLRTDAPSQMQPMLQNPAEVARSQLVQPIRAFPGEEPQTSVVTGGSRVMPGSEVYPGATMSGRVTGQQKQIPVPSHLVAPRRAMPDAEDVENDTSMVTGGARRMPM